MQTAIKLPPPEVPEPAPAPRGSRILLVGAPNVGKSALFNALTGRYVVVSNYPGNTVEISRGKATFAARAHAVVDTPGMYSPLPVSEEERVTQRLLLEARDELIVHVIDAKNLERGLPLTAQLRVLGLRVILVLNMMDEAEERGLSIDVAGLSAKLGVPVIPAVAITGRGVEALRSQVGAEKPDVAASEAGLFPPQPVPPSGRAAGRGRGEDSVGAGSLKKKN